MAAASAIAFPAFLQNRSYASESPEYEEIIKDPHFTTGFNLRSPKASEGVYDRWIPYPVEGKEITPEWLLGQWGTDGVLKSANGKTVCGNDYKKVAVAKTGEKADLTLDVYANKEYAGDVRKADRMWAHLLVEQGLKKVSRLVDLKSVKFHLEAKLLSSKLYKPELFDAGKHAAQYQVFFYLQDRNKESEGYGEMIWFGIPVYDNRERKTSRYEAGDFAGSGMFICTLAHDFLCKESAHDGKWITLEADLLEEMKNAFYIAQKKGFMQKTKSLDDIYLTGMNMGWEVPGLLDVSIQTRNLSLKTLSAK